MSALITETAGTALAGLVQIDLGWWKCAGYDLVQVAAPRTALGTAWIVWHGDHLMHTNDTLPAASAWVTAQLTGRDAR